MLKHVSFVTAHPEEVITFYGRLGGALLKDAVAPDGLRRLVVGFEGGGKLQFFVGESPPPATSWMEHVAVELPDLPATLKELERRGVTFSRPLHRSPGGRAVAFVLDPDGRQVELLQRGA